MKAPDLQNGFMIMQPEGPNRWCTGVECVLVRKSSDYAQPEAAYLSHECRAEAVHADPYAHPGVYEYVAISTWSGNYALRSGPSLTGVDGASEEDATASDVSHEQIDMGIKVTCPERDVRPLAFGEVLSMLQSDSQAGFRSPFMGISYRRDSFAYTLYAPCRYINFPHPVKEPRSYLQPISGYVLYEEGGRFYTAYVVTYIEGGDPKSLQFKVREPYNAGDYATHEFCRNVKIADGGIQCTFFDYESR